MVVDVAGSLVELVEVASPVVEVVPSEPETGTGPQAATRTNENATVRMRGMVTAPRWPVFQNGSPWLVLRLRAQRDRRVSTGVNHAVLCETRSCPTVSTA